MLFVGIDISKLKFDVAVLTDGLYKNKCFSNDIKGLGVRRQCRTL